MCLNIKKSNQIIINSLDEYKSLVSQKDKDCEEKKVKISSNVYKYFFRGQSDANWKLEPSINRSSKNEKNLIHRYYEEYANISLFQNISLIQHKESGTRFLDFSNNPLVALYFACKDHLEKDGKVYFLFFDGLDSNWNSSKILYYFTEMPIDKKELSVSDYKKYLINRDDSFSKNEFDLNADIINSVLYGNLIIPSDNDYSINERLNRQEGVFYVCPPKILHIGEREKKHIEDGYLWNSDCDVKFSRSEVQSPEWLNKSSLEEIIIKNTSKDLILKDLDKIHGINKEYLFPEI